MPSCLVTLRVRSKVLNVQGNSGSVRRWLGSVEGKKVSKKVKAQAPLMSNGNTGGKAGQPGLRSNLVILNKSESEPLVLRILGPDGKLEEKNGTITSEPEAPFLYGKFSVPETDKGSLPFIVFISQAGI